MEQQILMSWMTAIQSKMYDCERWRGPEGVSEKKNRLCMRLMTGMPPLLNLKLTSDNPFILTAKPAVTKAVRQQTEKNTVFFSKF